jgi:hypothetical protein
MGIEAGGSIRELCNQRCSKGSNDINKLALCNKRAKFACGQSASQKFLLGMVQGESFTSKVDSDDNIDDFLTLADIS